MPIQAFKQPFLEQFWRTGKHAREIPPDLRSRLTRKLTALNIVGELQELSAPPSNHLEALKGDRQGQHSIRVNEQWRLCFVWTTHGPAQVEFVDYH